MTATTRSGQIFSTAFLVILLVASVVASTAAAEPKSVPYTFLYEVGVANTQEAVRSEAALKDFKERALSAGLTLRIEPQEYIKHQLVEKSAGQTIKSLVVDQLMGCQVYDADCKQYVGNLNRRYGIKDVKELDAVAGEVLLPAKALRYSIWIDARNHYKEERVVVIGQTQLKTVAVMSNEFDQMLTPLKPMSSRGWSRFCNGGGCIDLYELTIR